MFIHRKPGWLISENQVTDEARALNRRTFLKGAGLLAVGGAVGTGVSMIGYPTRAASDPSAGLYPVSRNLRYRVDRDITPEDVNTEYNNFYEFGSHKQIARAAQKLPIRPWTVTIDGMVEKPVTLDIDDLLKRMSLEERVYRHRCVEAWSMVAPWSGFALSELLALAAPLSGAKFVRFETFMNKKVASGQRQSWYPWPYVEGITLAEAQNDLTFMVTGAYGKPLPKQMGAPLRLALPWKYGFKSIKSITRITLTDKQPVSFWEEIQPREYGFYANVNPDVAHPRWSQASERVLQTGDRVPTLKYNGYGEFVANMYDEAALGRKLFY